jgi:hypothetical protein
MAGAIVNTTFHVMKTAPWGILLGATFLDELECNLNFKNHTLEFETQDSNTHKMPFKVREKQQWRAAHTIYASHNCLLKPGHETIIHCK